MSGTKYNELLDAEVNAFIARTASCYPERSAPPGLQDNSLRFGITACGSGNKRVNLKLLS